jgi:hypothetical protein
MEENQLHSKYMVSTVTTGLWWSQACNNCNKPLANIQKESMKAAAQGTCLALVSDDHTLTHTVRTTTNLSLPKDAGCLASV